MKKNRPGSGSIATPHCQTHYTVVTVEESQHFVLTKCDQLRKKIYRLSYKKSIEESRRSFPKMNQEMEQTKNPKHSDESCFRLQQLPFLLFLLKACDVFCLLSGAFSPLHGFMVAWHHLLQSFFQCMKPYEKHGDIQIFGSRLRKLGAVTRQDLGCLLLYQFGCVR